MKGPLNLFVENNPNPKGNRRFLLNMLPKGSVGAEIGVAVGNFSSAILTVVRPSKLYLVDPFYYEDGQHAKNRFYGGKAGSQESMDTIHDFVCARFMSEEAVEIRRQKSVEFLREIPDNTLDWIYIDGDHDYLPCKTDILMSIPKVKVGGIIAGDDMNWGEEHGFPVRQAVDEIDKSEGRLGLTVIKHGQFVFERLV